MKKIVIAGKYNEKALELFQTLCPAGYQCEIVGTPSEEKLMAVTRDAEFLFVRGKVPLSDRLLENAERLRLIQKWGTGFDQYDMAQISRYHIPFMNCAGVNAVQVSEMTIALILTLYRRILPVSQDMKHGIWSKERFLPECRTIHGKTVGIIGIGNIGRRVAKLVQAFGATVQYYDTFRLPVEEEQACHITYSDLTVLLKTSDIVTLHVPLLPSTENMINASALSAMKPSAVVINTARGEIVNEQDLYEALRNNEIAGAALDVLEDEEQQSEANNPLFTLSNVVITPHMGASTDEVLQAMVERCFENAVGVDQGTIKASAYGNSRYLTQAS